MQTKEITSYSFYEFCRDVEQAVLAGYKFDFDSNTNFPQQFGSMLTAIMIKEAEVEIQAEQEQASEVQLEEKPVAKAGRKPRG